jgi:shikimate dehydrogenase
MRKFGLIGHPLTHSFSGKYFAEKFQRESINDTHYALYDMKHLDDISSLKQEPELRGFNVTIPYKESILPYLDSVDFIAQEIGAVNCVDIRDGRWMGYNTDAFGFEMSIKPFLENKYERALILGTGGASKAIAYVLKKWGIPYHFATREPRADNHLAYEALNATTIPFFPLIIQCTPIGTYPTLEECPPLAYEALGSSHFLYDVVYNPAESLFLKRGKAQGAQTMNGLRMLEMQAEKSWEIWNR